MGTWNSQSIAGFDAEVFQPAQRHAHGFVVVYLHGVHLQRLSQQPRFTQLFDEWGLTVVAPVTGRCWWASRPCPDFHPTLTPERHLLDNVLPFISERWQIQPPRIGLLGTSMGGQGALRFAYRFPDRFPVVAAIAPAIDYQIRWDEDEILQSMYPEPEAVRQDTATLHIHPLNWPRHQFFCCDPADLRWWDGADRLRMKLYSLGVPHECDLDTTGGGHGFAYYDVMAERAVRFLVERLDQERRRLV
ncbi:MAG: alpha/beta hydrolase-fold protein [Pirellulaceae bacterium]